MRIVHSVAVRLLPPEGCVASAVHTLAVTAVLEKYQLLAIVIVLRLTMILHGASRCITLIYVEAAISISTTSFFRINKSLLRKVLFVCVVPILVFAVNFGASLNLRPLHDFIDQHLDHIQNDAQSSSIAGRRCLIVCSICLCDGFIFGLDLFFVYVVKVLEQDG